MKTTPRTDTPWQHFKGVWGASLVVVILTASSCEQPPEAQGTELASVTQRITGPEVISTDKVLILGSSVSGGLASREAQAVAASSPHTQIDVVTPEQWRALTAQQFMAYRALIIGDAACQSGTAAFQAAVDTRNVWGIIVDGDVALLSTDPSHNHTDEVVEGGIQYVLNSVQWRTGMYIALGCAYQDAPANTPVALLEPFGAFQVQGIPGCADSGHIFEMRNDMLSRNIWDGMLSGDGCAARTVFTTYPDHTFSFAALAMQSNGAPLPGQRTYVDFTYDPENETAVVGTPYILVGGAETLGAGCGLPNSTPDEQCDLGDDLNGAPAVRGQHPWETCSFSCHLHWCGDGFVDSSQGEECDNGSNNGRTSDASGRIGTCTSFCKLATPVQPPPKHPPYALCKDVTTVAEYTCGVPASIDNGSYDPDGDLVGCTQEPAGPYAIGTSQVTLTCVDQQGQTGTCTGMVTVLDQVVPTITLRGSANPSLECTLGGAYNDPGASATDLCDGPLPVVTSGQVRAGVPATYELRYEAKDSAGNSAIPAKRQVAVSDTQAPALTLNGLAHETLECGTLYADPGATALDLCAGSLTQQITQSGAVNTNALGAYTLRYNVKDPAGNAAPELNRTVTVADTLPPSVLLMGPLSLQVECGDSHYVDPGATANDACAGELPAVPTSSADPNTPGSYSIRYSATDPSGNTGTSSASRTVTVSDTLPPSLALNGQATQILECGSPYSDPGATAEDQCAGDLTGAIVTTGAVKSQEPGTYPLTYSVTDGANHSDSKTRTVTVRDTLAPAVTLVGSLYLQVECGDDTYADPGATANDACAGELPAVPSNATNPNTPGSYNIRYSATDPSGNTGTSSASRTVIVSDTLPPSLVLLGPATLNLECGSPFSDLGATASDQCAGDLTGAIAKTGTVNSSIPGDYLLTYDVADPSGHITSARRLVNVRDTLPPSITLRGPLDLQFECGTTYQDPGVEAFDACAGDVSSRVLVTGNVNPGSAGAYMLSYSVTDPSGNSAAAAAHRTVTVTDSFAPAISLKGPATQTLECGSPYHEQGASAYDACAGELTDHIVRSGAVNPAVPGSYALSYSVSDPSGLIAATGRSVMVVDTQPPSIVCPKPALVQLLELDEAIVTPALAQATDACDTAVQVSHPTKTRFPVGTTVLTYTATDAAGNTASCTSAVTVEKILRPDTWIVSGPPDETEDTDAQFKFAASKPQVTYECSLEGQDFTKCSELTTLNSLSEGPHQLRVRARDTLGNVDPTPASGTWTVLPSLDRAVLGGGNGCAAASGEPSVLAVIGLALVLRRKGQRSHRRHLTWVRLAGLGLPLLGTATSAQPRRLPPFEMERLSLNPSATGSLVLGTGELLPDGAYRFSITGHYENNPLVYVLNGERLGTVVQYRATAHVSAAYGVKDTLELGVQIPLLLHQHGDDLTAQGLISPDTGPALGTPMATLRWKLLSESHEAPMDLSVGVQAGPRLGQATALARELRAIPSVMLGRRYGLLRAALDVGMLLRTRSILTPDKKIEDELGNAVRLGAVLATTGEGLRGELTLIAAVPLRREGYSVEALGGLRLPLNTSVEAYGLAGLGYGNAPGTPDFRVLLGVAYGRMPPACIAGGRHAPAECPDLDDDEDGIRNRGDVCPLEGGAVDERGCPLQDSDSDGIADGDDQCPNAPGRADHLGCPPVDTDGDGLLDDQDACPQVPGLPELDGCPPQDTDGDSVPDAQDNCPCDAGPASNEGCPEKEKQYVAIEPDRIALKDAIYFEFNTATIQPRSYPLLNQVAQVLEAHSAMGSLTIEGYTDDIGSAAYNLRLSQRRAQAVLEYLLQQGVARERMMAHGYGKSHPVQSNATAEGRAANRRVEFKTRAPEDQP